MADAPKTKPLVYLDNSATSFPKPAQVTDAVRDCLDKSLTVARSTHLADFRADEVLKRCRAKLARFFNADSPDEMVYTYSATDGLNIAINGVIKPGGHVIVSPLEHHSVMRPLHHLRDTAGVTWTELQGDKDGVVDPDELKQVVQKNTCAVIINWISNVTGTVQPVEAIGEVAKELGLPYVVDGAQATGTHPVDVQAIGCCAMAQPAHKALMSLPGLGVLYVNKDAALTPWRIGGTGYRSDLLMQPEERPIRYEAGTTNVPAIVGLDAAMDWFEETGLDNIQKYCAKLTARLFHALGEVPGVEVVGPEPTLHSGFLVSFCVGDTDPLVVSQILAERYSISSRAGLHCAPTAHHHFGTYDKGGTVRFSVGFFTTEAETQSALDAVSEIAGELG